MRQSSELRPSHGYGSPLRGYGSPLRGYGSRSLKARHVRGYKRGIPESCAFSIPTMAPSIDSQDSVTIHEPIDLDKRFRASHLLDPSRPKKTLDFGSDGVSCSIGILGDII